MSRYIYFIFLHMYITVGLVKLFFMLRSSKIYVIYNLQRLHIFHSIHFDYLINRKNISDFILISLHMTWGTQHLAVHIMHGNWSAQTPNLIKTILGSKVIEQNVWKQNILTANSSIGVNWIHKLSPKLNYLQI